MRAHISVDRRTRREIDRLAHLRVDEERKHMTRRVYKALIYVLNTEFGFGAVRLKRTVDKMNEVLSEVNDNTEFWRHLDHHVIDYLGIPFEREKTDIDGNLIDN